MSASAVAPVVWPLGKQASGSADSQSGENCCGKNAVKHLPAIIARKGAVEIGSHVRRPRPRHRNAVARVQQIKTAGDVSGVAPADRASSAGERAKSNRLRSRSSMIRAAPLATAVVVSAKTPTQIVPKRTVIQSLFGLPRDTMAPQAIAVPRKPCSSFGEGRRLASERPNSTLHPTRPFVGPAAEPPRVRVRHGVTATAISFRLAFVAAAAAPLCRWQVVAARRVSVKLLGGCRYGGEALPRTSAAIPRATQAVRCRVLVRAQDGRATSSQCRSDVLIGHSRRCC